MVNCLDRLGVMIDCSRNAVMSIDGYKKLFPLLKNMGYDTVLVYMEDTYLVDNEPYFGYMRGGYSKEELKQIDTLGKKNNLEVIPCIQTLAHLDTLDKWGVYPKDTKGILLVDDDKTYILIDNMLKTLSECFSSKYIHLGMDEAHMLGRGKYLDLHGYKSVGEIMRLHLKKVLKICQKYDYKSMIWSDMFFRGWNNGEYYCGEKELPQEYISAYPKDVIPVYWNYYSKDKQEYVNMLENHKKLSNEVWFAGGAWTWGGFMPHNKFSLQTMLPALDACKEKGVKNIFFTMWGDNGGECSRFSVLPTLFYLAEYLRGTDKNSIEEKFFKQFNISFNDFLLLDLPNEITGKEAICEHPKNPSKYMLYSDLFLGHLDWTVKTSCEQVLFNLEKRLDLVKRGGFGYLFATAKSLCSVLKYKYALGVKIRKAYQEKNSKKLKALSKDFNKLIKEVKGFSLRFENQWLKENKPYGLEVHQLRLGGLVARIEYCKKQVGLYLSGKITRIEELEGNILSFGEKELSGYFNDYLSIVSSNPI